MPTTVRPPVFTMRPSALARAVQLVDRGAFVRRVIPIPVMIALDEPALLMDAHLCFGVSEGEAVPPGFAARATAYAAFLLSPEKRRFLFDSHLSLDDIMRVSADEPPTAHEIARAELFDAVQGGTRAVLLGMSETDLVLRTVREQPHMDHA